MKVQGRVVATSLAAVAILATLALYRAQLVQVIQNVAFEMRSSPYGAVILTAVIVLVSTPPLLGFTFFVTLSGFVYGFPLGAIPAVSGAMLGSAVCFGVIRYLNFGRTIQSTLQRKELYMAVQEAIQDGGFGMLMLIRLSPIPWQFTNAILSLLPTLPPQTYLMTSFLACWKVCLEVWFGSQFASLSDPNLPAAAHRLTLVTMATSVVIFIIVAVWLHRLTMQKVRAARQQAGMHITVLVE